MPTAKDWAVRDYRSYLVMVAKRATATVNEDHIDDCLAAARLPAQPAARFRIASTPRVYENPGLPKLRPAAK